MQCAGDLEKYGCDDGKNGGYLPPGVDAPGASEQLRAMGTVPSAAECVALGKKYNRRFLGWANTSHPGAFNCYSTDQFNAGCVWSGDWCYYALPQNGEPLIVTRQCAYEPRFLPVDCSL